MTDQQEESDGINEIDLLLEDYTSLQAAHTSLVQRCETQAADIYAEVQGEMDSLRARIKELESQLTAADSEKEELSNTVRDLRVRVEESRRAVMRLQSAGSAAAAASANNGTGSSSGASSSSNAANHPNRRSMGPAALSSWNPREITSALGIGTSSQGSTSHDTIDESAELKKSKRASLAFGPNGTGTLGRRSTLGHRRVASGSRVAHDDDEAQISGSQSSSSQGLRELHLGTGPVSGISSKRSSYVGAPVRSPPSDTIDLPGSDAIPIKTSAGSLLLPFAPARGSSYSSSQSGKDDAEGGPVFPSSESRSSLSQSPSNKTSPIAEVEETESPLRSGLSTARAGPTTGMPQAGSSFGAMQQQRVDYDKLQRMLAEQKFRVHDRDVKLEELMKAMQGLRAELNEAREARQASEACLKALRDFVKDEGGQSIDSDGGSQALKGVKLPPLPSDKGLEDLSSDSAFHPSTPGQIASGSKETATPTQASASGWKSFGSTFAGLSRAKSHASEEAVIKSPSLQGDAFNTGPLSPAANIGQSIGSLWSRSTATKKRDSESVASTAPSESTAATNGESRPTSSISSTVGAANLADVFPPTSFKGFNWFGKKATAAGGDENAGETTVEAALSTRVSSPPFANLDNHVLTLDQINTAAPHGVRKPSIGSSNNTSQDDGAVANDRVRKAREKSGLIDEDTGFVPPTF